MARDRDERRSYYKTDQEKIQKKLAEVGQGSYFKPKEGKNVIRILPPWSKEGLWYKEAVLHYGLEKDGKKRGYSCLKQFDKDCPICDKREDLLKGDKEEKAMSDDLRPRTKYYANILDYKTGKVMIWGFTPKTLGILLSIANDEDYGDIADPDKGYDIVIERTGTTRTDTKYSIRCRPKSSSIPDEIDWEKDLKNLDEVIEEPDEEEIQDILDEMFSGGGKKKHHDDDDDDEDKGKKHHHEDDDDDDKDKKRHDDDDDDDDKEDDDDDDDDKGKKHREDDDEDDRRRRRKERREKRRNRE